MKKIVIIITIIVSITISLIGLFMIINGSLEMYPTSEQIEKAHITGWLLW